MSSVLYDVPGPKARRRTAIGTVVGGLLVLGAFGAVVAKLSAAGQFAPEMWETFLDPGIQEALLRGLGATLRAGLFAIVLAVVFGVVFAAARLSDHVWLRVPATTVIEFFRSVPLLLLILFLYIGFGNQFEELGESLEDALPSAVAGFVGTDLMSTLAPLVLGLMLYNGAVLAEIFRAGILAVPHGQAEAAYAIGLRKNQVMRIVLVPQAVRIMLPAIISQCVVALKDSALGFAIGYLDLVRTGRLIWDAEFNIIPTALVIAAIYIVINMSLSYLAIWLERRQSGRYGKAAVKETEAAVDVA